MEEDEMQIWPAHTADSVCRRTLNDDKFNVLAEELAMQHCMQGFDVRRELSEIDMVVTSCGSMIQGTPDGGFIDSDELLRLVQVVRVPLLPEMDEDEVADVLYHTVLTKIVKSQAWMKQTCTLPHDFIIFCWLPPVGAYEAFTEQSEALIWTEALLWNVRAGGWPFSFILEIPPAPGEIFPANFGIRSGERKIHFEALCFFLNPSDFEEEDEDDVMEWHLFDQDIEDNVLTDMVPAEELPRHLLALIALAIRRIERAGEEQDREHILQGLRVLLLDLNDAPAECKLVFIEQYMSNPGRDAREPKGYSPVPKVWGHLWVVPIIEGSGLGLGQRPWWHLGANGSSSC
mmetsp:Transcript_83084/g.144296  ORF Transcript_83084/g.144296 Transcript_83084/m.144296 type:complete len:345 (+) Transcript_83084:58-1092(+)